MTGLMLALLVGWLFATGTYLLLRRDPIKLLLGLGLLSYGVNLLLLTSSTMRRGIPPIIRDKAAFTGDISEFVDPLPQALILTAIVISFGVSAFVVILIHRRNVLIADNARSAGISEVEAVGDPFAATAHYLTGIDQDPDDYEWLEYSLSGERRQDSVPAAPPSLPPADATGRTNPSEL
jgi:multicomponent Na+:H+ antiporter subunit C